MLIVFSNSFVGKLAFTEILGPTSTAILANYPSDDYYYSSLDYGTISENNSNEKNDSKTTNSTYSLFSNTSRLDSNKIGNSQEQLSRINIGVLIFSLCIAFIFVCFIFAFTFFAKWARKTRSDDKNIGNHYQSVKQTDI